MARTVLPFVGAAVGWFFGAPQIGFAIGSIIGNAVDPIKNVGPKIGETGAQTSSEGAPRAIVYGTAPVSGNVIYSGPLIHREVETEEGKGGPVSVQDHVYRTFAVRACEGPIGGYLRIWEDDKLVYDARPDSIMSPAESTKWAENVVMYNGDEAQLPDSNLQLIFGVDEVPAHRGTAYVVFVEKDLTNRQGSLSQYRFEVASNATPAVWPGYAWTIVENTSWLAQACIVYSGNRAVVSGTGDTTSWTSSNLDTWVPASLAPNGASSLAYGNNLFVAVVQGNNDYAFSSANGYAWSSIPTVTSFDKYGIAYGNGIFVIVGYYGALGTARTAVGIGGSWTEHNISDPIAGPLRFAAGLFVAMQNSVLWVSSDGVAWASHACPSGGVDIVWAEELSLWVLVREGLGNSSIATSPDLITWTVRSTPTTTYHAIAWAPEEGLFAIVGDSGSFATSPDGINWTSRPAMPSGTYTGVVWAADRGKFIAVSSGTSQVVISDTTPGSIGGLPVTLSDIVSDIHVRCEVPAANYDVSELTDEVTGLVLAGDYTGSDAINTLRSPYFFDKAEYDKKLWYPKRGKPVVATLVIDDLVEEPDTSKREQAVEYPRKFHLFYQHARSGYAVVKSTSSRSSPDARVVGEATTQVPVVLNEDQAAQTVHMMHKVAYAEAEGEVKLSLPESFLRFVPSDALGLVLRGRVSRLRLQSAEYAEGVLTYTLRHDRQSAYTSNVTGVPIPDPTPPPGTIVGDTVLAVLDIASRVDSEDDLNIYYGVTGALPPWHGAIVQRSTDGGANYANAASITRAHVMGEILSAVPIASEHYTDTTNTVTVRLYRAGQTIDDITNTQFLAEGGAFALEKADGSWEVMQYRDAAQDSAGDFILSTLHRGRLASGPAAHGPGARFVMLDRVEHVAAQSAWIDQALTHRAVSFDDTPESASEQTDTYLGRSQIEWPVASLVLARDGSDVITGTWAPRHRFGTDDAPVASVNFTGYRVTLDGTVSFDTTAASFTYDASALADPLVVTVAALNRITGAGPAESGTI